MNADLEKTLAELGPGYRGMVARMKAPFAEVSRPCGGVSPSSRWWRQPSSWLVAASLAVAFVSAVVLFRTGTPSSANPRLGPGVYTVAYISTPDAVDEMVRTQSPDGSWQNDFVTRQNAAALKDVAGARLAYRKAVRYLRSKGLSPMTESEFRERAGLAQAEAFRF